MDTTWKSFEETIRRGRNRSSNTLIVTDDGDVDHYYYDYDYAEAILK